MKFNVKKSIEILERSPSMIETMLSGLSEEWIRNNEGGETWTVYDVVGHLVHGEKTDWIARTKIILSNSQNKTFTPFDRFAQQNEDQNKPIEDLLSDFKILREKNIKELLAFKIDDSDLLRTGIHPALGEVTLQQLLSTWVVHDLNHIAQISRVLAFQYKDNVGPWQQYLRIVN